jgi:pimeloyl-ACP methyl ester carboxylesterase
MAPNDPFLAKPKVLKLLLLALLTSALLFLLAWIFIPFGPGPEAWAALVSDSKIHVEQTADWVTFKPTGPSPTTGLIFFPGSHVDYRSYAPVAREIALNGYQVTVVRVPASLAVFGITRADRVIAAYPAIRHWAIGGHSLGGTIAMSYAAWHPNTIQGVVLWAAPPMANLSRSGMAGAVTYGTNDVGIWLDAVQAGIPLLPPGTSVEPIVGGGHTGFGDYTTEFGGQSAGISPQLQQAYAADLTVRLLRKIAGN